MNPCDVHGCEGKKCGEDCLLGDIMGVCNKNGECDFDVSGVTSSGQCGIFNFNWYRLVNESCNLIIYWISTKWYNNVIINNL